MVVNKKRNAAEDGLIRNRAAAAALFAFAALKGRWSVYSGIDRAKVREDFLEVFGNTYLNYLIHRYYSIIK
jgi:hypothetical protein